MKIDLTEMTNPPLMCNMGPPFKLDTFGLIVTLAQQFKSSSTRYLLLAATQWTRP